MVPIIYVRYGNLKAHTHASLHQTRQRNKNIYFLGDEDPSIEGVKFFDISHYDVGIEEFKRAYVHLSTNKYIFEVYCIIRWFSLRNLVRDLNIEHFYYCDDDVFNFCEIEKIHGLYKKFDASFLFPEKLELASACCSFWTKAALEDFCDFIMAEYNANLGRYVSIWNAVSARDERGGVSDMTFLYFFSLGRNIGSLTKLTEEGCFDMNPLISQNEIADEYQMERPYLLKKKIKKIVFKQNDAFAFSKQSKNPVRIFASPEQAKFEIIKSERSILSKAINYMFHSK